MNEEKKIEETPFILYHILPDSWSDTEREAHPITAEKLSMPSRIERESLSSML